MVVSQLSSQQWKRLSFPSTVCCCGALTIDCASFHLYMRRVSHNDILSGIGSNANIDGGDAVKALYDCSFIRNLRCICKWNSYSLSVKHSSGGVVGMVTRRWNVCKNKSREVLVVAV